MATISALKSINFAKIYEANSLKDQTKSDLKQYEKEIWKLLIQTF